jgi:hypothetical protein
MFDGALCEYWITATCSATFLSTGFAIKATVRKESASVMIFFIIVWVLVNIYYVKFILGLSSATTKIKQ